MNFPRGARTASLVFVTLLAAVLVSDVAVVPGCQGNCQAFSATAQAQLLPPSPKPPILGVAPFDGAEEVNPLTTPTVEVLDGRITAVSLVDDWGNVVPGEFSPDRTSWQPTERLNFARSYSMTVDSLSASGVELSRASTFDTLSPYNYVHPYLEVQGGFAINEKVKYGVGTVVRAHFDEPIADKALAERNMTVTADPPVSGSWFWVDDYIAHFRPERYYAAGTRVSVALNMFGLKLGEGLYGQENAAANFTIGDSHIAIANDITKQISVFDNGKLVRTMPTSMGRGGTTTVGDKTFSWYTPPGVYTLLDKAEVIVMDSSTYGVPAGSAVSYRRKVAWATRISTDGIYLHQLDDTLWAQGNTNLSSGCLNLNGENAQWFHDFAQPGDVVEVRYTGGPPLSLKQGGDWSIPWDEWLKGSALAPGGAPTPPPPAPTAATLTAPGP